MVPEGVQRDEKFPGADSPPSGLQDGISKKEIDAPGFDRIPDPRVDPADLERIRGSIERSARARAVLAAEAEETGALVTIGDRVRAIWIVVEMVVEELVGAAETLFGPGTGAEKKRFVTDKALELLIELERRHDFIPGWLETIVFRSIGFALDFIIERVVKQLKASKRL